MLFTDRKDGGRQLAERLKDYKDKDVVVLALPRGGIVTAAEVARYLRAPLGLALVRKIGHPEYSEYAIGAIAEGEEPVYNEGELSTVDDEWLDREEAAARELIERRRHLYYGEEFEEPVVKDKLVILVDDGMATGYTMNAAVKLVQNRGAKEVIVAVPVASRDSVDMLEGVADEVIVLEDPDSFMQAVGAHYEDFNQVEDEEVRTLLREVNNELRKKIA